MLSESFAEYSSLMVMKQGSKPLEMKKFIKYDMNEYLMGRRDGQEKEQPLRTVDNQSHIHYGKGSVVLYALQDYVGEENVNAALNKFLEAYKYQEPPYPNSNDFLSMLEEEVPDSLSYLITDWIYEITFYDLRVESATSVKLDNGQYKIDLEVIAKKIKIDEDGNPNDVTINDWIDIGFSMGEEDEDLLFRERKFFDSEETTISLVLDKLPTYAHVDPMRLLIDRVGKDNRIKIAVK